jgi:hypothetical protein
MADTTDIWNKLRTPPKDALKPIIGGRLKGKSDINPTWRMQAMTEVFGPVGMGWTYTIDEIRMVDGSEGQVVCFVRVSVKYKLNGEWSEPIPGVGGSMFIERESKGPWTSDEAVKMATTDALGVALKALGVAADVYRGHYDGKHNTARPAEPRQAPPPPKPESKQAPRSTSSEPAGMMDHHRRVMSAIDEAKAHGLSAQDVREVLGSCGFERVSEIGASQASTVIAELAAVAGRLSAA